MGRQIGYIFLIFIVAYIVVYVSYFVLVKREIITGGLGYQAGLDTETKVLSIQNIQQKCLPPLSLNSKTTSNHRRLYFRCAEQSSNLSMATTADVNVPSIHSQDPCLFSAIQNFCPGIRARKVPNIVHYIWFNLDTMSFFTLLSFMSVHRFQKPCVILVHGSLPRGPYWKFLVRRVPNVIHVDMDPPDTVNGRSFGSEGHKANLVRIQVLREYGGIYMDLDTVLLRSLDPLRDHSVTMSLEYWTNLWNGLIVSEPNAIFIRNWINYFENNYHFDPDNYFEFSLFLPTKIARKHPSWIHVENMTFCTPDGIHRNQIFSENYDWGDNYAMHLYIRYYKHKNNFRDVRALNTTMGALARHVLYDTREVCKD